MKKYYDHNSGEQKPSPFPSRPKNMPDMYLFDGRGLDEIIAEQEAITWTSDSDLHGTYCILNDTECALTAIENACGSVIIPAELDGRHVVAIGPQACKGQDDLCDLQLPSSVRFLGYKAFAYSTALRNVSFAEGLEYIDGYAFMDSGLLSFVAPSTLKTIGTRAFFSCSDLREAALNEGLLFLGDEAFAKTALSEIRIPSTVDRIGARVVEGSDRIPCVRLYVDSRNPKYVSDEFGFGLYERGISGLIMVSLYGNPRYYKVNPHTQVIGPHALALHKELESVELPMGLLRIDEGAFRGCRNLMKIDLPATLEELGHRVFFDTGIKQIYIPAHVRRMTDSSLLVHSGREVTLLYAPLKIQIDPTNPVFYEQGGLVCEHLDSGTDKALIYAGSQRRVEVSKDITQLGEYLLYGVSGVDELILHDGIEPFESHAFVVAHSIGHVQVNLDEPIDGRSRVDLFFAQDNTDRSNFIYMFKDETIDIELMCSMSDAGILLLPDQFVRGCIALRRLHDPFLLDPRREKGLTDMVRVNLKAICTDFAVNHYNSGYAQMFDLGFINEENVNDVIEWVRATKNIAATSYVMELKRQYLGMDAFSDYDL